MGIKQLYNDNLRKLPNEYGDVSVMNYHQIPSLSVPLVYAFHLKGAPKDTSPYFLSNFRKNVLLLYCFKNLFFIIDIINIRFFNLYVF